MDITTLPAYLKIPVFIIGLPIIVMVGLIIMILLVVSLLVGYCYMFYDTMFFKEDDDYYFPGNRI